MHPAQRAKQRRRHLAARLRSLDGGDISTQVEHCRAYECYLRRYQPLRWLWLQRLVTEHMYPDKRVGYSHLDLWNRRP